VIARGTVGRRVLFIGLALAVFGAGCEATAGSGDRHEDPTGWSRVAIAEGISLAIPADLAPVQTAGADSVFRVYESESLQLSIDYGWYSDSLSRTQGEDLVRRPVKVDGWSALLVTYRDAGASTGLHHVSALHVADLGRGAVKLTLVVRGHSEGDHERAVQIIRSLRIDPPLRETTTDKR